MNSERKAWWAGVQALISGVDRHDAMCRRLSQGPGAALARIEQERAEVWELARSQEKLIAVQRAAVADRDVRLAKVAHARDCFEGGLTTEGVNAVDEALDGWVPVL